MKLLIEKTRSPMRVVRTRFVAIVRPYAIRMSAKPISPKIPITENRNVIHSVESRGGSLIVDRMSTTGSTRTFFWNPHIT
jgi:hypothetical protein